MKQLSLLLLACLTTGCFAAESAPANPSCWEFVKMLRDPQYGSSIDNKYAGVDVLTIPGYADCAKKYDQLSRLSDRRDIDPADLELLHVIKSRIAKRLALPRCKEPEYLSLEEAVAQDEEMIAREKAFNAALKEARERLTLLSQEMELPRGLR